MPQAPSASEREALDGFKRRLAEVMVRSRLNLRDDLRVINVLWDRLQVERIAGARELRPFWEGASSPPGSRAVLYVNIPYCRQKCSFCKFQVRTAPTPRALARYAADVVREAEFFSPGLAGTRFDFVQAGGGTPSLLPAARMKELFGAVFARFDAGRAALRSIEFHPSSASPAKLRACRAAGFNRVSFGVQTLDRSLLSRLRRADQTEARVRRAVRWAREAGFDIVAVELIAGLWGDTPEGFLRGAVRLLRQRPSSLSVNQLNLTADYMKAEGIDTEKYAAFRAETMPALAQALRERAAGLGYRAESLSETRGIWTLVRDDLPTPARADGCEALDRVLGLGQGAWSHVPGRAWYQRTTLEFSQEKPIYRMRRQTPETAMAAYVRHALINGSFVDFRAFRDAFGEDFRRRYALELRLLELFGRVRLEDAGARFLPVELTERYFFGSIFFVRQWARLTAGRALLGPDYLRRLAEAVLPG